VAEEVGFEPTVPVTRDGGFQDRCLKPLDHSSGWTIIQPEDGGPNFEVLLQRDAPFAFFFISPPAVLRTT
jgi:hypothetical protein